MRNNLKEIEERLQVFFEEQLQWISGKDTIRIATKEVLSSLVNQIVEKDNKKYAPNIFRISFKHKEKIDRADIKAWNTLVVEIIKDTAREKNLHFSGPVHVQQFFDSNIDEEIIVNVAFSSISTSKTTSLFVTNDEKKAIPPRPLKGYLITPYETIFSLTKKVINIGRDEANELVIDNLRVSRLHAQIREINGKYILFDIDSTAGTKVNGRRINQHSLVTGDVIEIADVALIYGSDSENDAQISGRTHTEIISLPGRKK